MSEGRWEHYPHQADIGIRGVGPTLASAFEQSALAMMAVICDINEIKPEESVVIHCKAPNDELLLMDWLNALVFEMAVRGFLFTRFKVHITKHQLHATAWGEALDIVRHRPAVEVKGATLTELKVSQNTTGEWIAQCVIDV